MIKNSFFGFHILFTPQAKRELKKLAPDVADKIDKKIKDLVKGAENIDVIKMKGVSETYRMRWGDYRVIFEKKKDIITILVISVGHRKEVYRDY